MFVGHYAVALAAKHAVPRVSLGVLFAATQLPDLIWPVCVLAGWEQVEIAPGITAFNPLDFTSYPWSHSLLMVVAWGALAGLTWAAVRRDGRAAIVIGALVVSHWVLDWISHRADLLLWPGGTTPVGLGLWQSVAATMLVEGGAYVVGVVAYLRGTGPVDGAGCAARWGMPALLGLLGVIYLADRAGTPPPNATFLAWFALGGGLLPVAWAGWADRYRMAR